MCTFLDTHLCMHVCMRLCTYVCICVYMCTYIQYSKYVRISVQYTCGVCVRLHKVHTYIRVCIQYVHTYVSIVSV